MHLSSIGGDKTHLNVGNNTETHRLTYRLKQAVVWILAVVVTLAVVWTLAVVVKSCKEIKPQM